ncbi:MAG: ribosomal protein L11 methyltransferase [Verrucomicrobia bacterium]|nr:MAG: ribosomal protein L11 methyltransferase [Verrucomicrobiota bacterium]
MQQLAEHRFTWSRRTTATAAESWFETLSHLGPMRVMVTQNAGSTSAQIQAHGLTQSEAGALAAEYGGKISEATWLTKTNSPQRAPIRVRGRFSVVSTEAERTASLESSGKPALWIPAGLAFGTGEHATTAMCLRHLADIARPLARESWEFLDLGTGSAILAMAARVLGARKVLGTDFDALALRTAKENVSNNNLNHIKLVRSDVLKWNPERTWEVVAANLFSGVLIEAAPVIARAVAKGGHLLLSGVLREQEAEVLAAFSAQKLTVERVVRKGKWISAHARKSATAKR